jgi:succinate-semialdehyde dehydrogenase/glutarate-semialdehyde dehydrogenase
MIEPGPTLAADGDNHAQVRDPQRTNPLPPELLTRLVARAGVPPHRPPLSVIDPVTQAVLGTVPCAVPADITSAVAKARRAQRAWMATSLHDRRRIMLKFHDLVLARQKDILDLVQWETGKARISAFEEAADVANAARYYTRTARRVLRPCRRRGLFPVLTSAHLLHRPKGVVGIISPGNYPLSLSITDAIPAILAGNAVVAVPDAAAPFTALWVADILAQAGLPQGVLTMVTGHGAELGPCLIESANFVCYTGSTVVGRQVGSECTRRLVDCTLELGGKNPMIVLADADLRRAVDGAIRGCFTSTGQLCLSFERIYVEHPLYQAFVAQLAERTTKLVLSGALNYGVHVGSLSSSRQLDKVIRHVEDAIAHGARLVAGGRHRPDVGPLFYEPTILTDVPDDAQMAREETFGPVVAVYEIADANEAIRRANATDFGLHAAVWTRSPRRGIRIAAQLHTGSVAINEAYGSTYASYDLPSGGTGASGLGRRHGPEGLLRFTESQAIAIQRLLPIGPGTTISDTAYARMLTIGLAIYRRIPTRR